VPRQNELRRQLGFLGTISLSVGVMAPTLAMSVTGGQAARLIGRAAPLAFVFAALGVALVAYGFVRLAGHFSHAGSVYAFTGLTLGPRAGFFAAAYDARGHGQSQPGPSYEYPELVGDLEAVLADRGLDKAALVGSSMGAATAMAFALEHPERVPALVQITPAYTGYARTGDVDGQTWERMAAELERGGVDAFVEVAQPGDLPPRWRDVAREATRQRMERHERPDAVAQALRQIPASIAWKGLERLTGLDVPVLIVASRDEADTLHPLAVAQEYERRLPRVELVVEERGQSPLAWQGARLSGVIGDFLERVGYPPS
jgi:pimeloyl-ACP methyl ester carboxylesterase